MSQNVPSVRDLLLNGTRRERARSAVRLVTPVGIELVLMARRNENVQRRLDAGVVRSVAAESRYEEAIQFLVARGLDEQAVRAGSMPETSLDYVRTTVGPLLPTDRPLRALHVGNFVGVSLCSLSLMVRECHPESVAVSIDPNMTHRGIEDPQSHVVALLHHFGLLRSSVVLPGYTLEQSAGEDVNERFESDYARNLAPEYVLASLSRVAGAPFDVVLLDGSHEEDYLEREFADVGPLLGPGSIVVFDDVSESWDGVMNVFGRAAMDNATTEIGRDGRVGILRVQNAGALTATPDEVSNGSPVR